MWRDFPVLPLQGTQVRSLVRELKMSCKLLGQAKKKKKEWKPLPLKKTLWRESPLATAGDC